MAREGKTLTQCIVNYSFLLTYEGPLDTSSLVVQYCFLANIEQIVFKKNQNKNCPSSNFYNCQFGQKLINIHFILTLRQNIPLHYSYSRIVCFTSTLGRACHRLEFTIYLGRESRQFLLASHLKIVPSQRGWQMQIIVSSIIVQYFRSRGETAHPGREIQIRKCQYSTFQTYYSFPSCFKIVLWFLFIPLMY